ncbi:hypothetical protein V8E36_008283 [Tilletia maclaganii]
MERKKARARSRRLMMLVDGADCRRLWSEVYACECELEESEARSVVALERHGPTSGRRSTLALVRLGCCFSDCRRRKVSSCWNYCLSCWCRLRWSTYRVDGCGSHHSGGGLVMWESGLTPRVGIGSGLAKARGEGSAELRERESCFRGVVRHLPELLLYGHPRDGVRRRDGGECARRGSRGRRDCMSWCTRRCGSAGHLAIQIPPGHCLRGMVTNRCEGAGHGTISGGSGSTVALT